mgnify:CR=1 FL=1
MDGILNTFARELSLGQRMRADLAMMLLHSPELILLDEPTLGLDVVAKRQMIEFLKKINREDGVTILVTSHDICSMGARRISTSLIPSVRDNISSKSRMGVWDRSVSNSKTPCFPPSSRKENTI